MKPRVPWIRSRLLLGFLLAFAAACTLFSCSLYNRDFPQAGGPFDPKMDYVVQVDDYGAFWDPEVPNRLLRVIAENVQKTNVVVVVFVHGWHHNAQNDDDNARDFAETMRKLREAMVDNKDGRPGIYRQSRRNLTGVSRGLCQRRRRPRAQRHLRAEALGVPERLRGDHRRQAPVARVAGSARVPVAGQAGARAATLSV